MASPHPWKKRLHADDEPHLSKRLLTNSEAASGPTIHSDTIVSTCSGPIKVYNPSRAFHPSLDSECTRNSCMTASEVSSTSAGSAVRDGSKQSPVKSLWQGKRGFGTYASDCSRYESDVTGASINKAGMHESFSSSISKLARLESDAIWQHTDPSATTHQGRVDLSIFSRQTWQPRARRCSSVAYESGSSCDGAGSEEKYSLKDGFALSRKKFQLSHGPVGGKPSFGIDMEQGTRAERGTGPAWLGISALGTNNNCKCASNNVSDSGEITGEECTSLYMLASSCLGFKDDAGHELAESHDRVEECEEKEENAVQESHPSYVLSSGRLSLQEEARLGRRAPTIDRDFEEYFAALML